MEALASSLQTGKAQLHSKMRLYCNHANGSVPALAGFPDMVSTFGNSQALSVSASDLQKVQLPLLVLTGQSAEHQIPRTLAS